MKRKLYLAVILVILGLVMGACAPTAAPTEEPEETQAPEEEATEEAAEPYKVAVLVWSMAEEFGVDVITGAQNAADKLGVEMMYPDPAGDMQKEIAIIEDLIQQDVDAVAIAPVDAEAVVPYVDKMREAGIVVVNWDIITEAECDAYIAADNYKGGQVSAENFLEKHGPEGTVLIIDDVPGVTTAEERTAGFEDYLAEHAPDIEIIHQLSTGTRDTHRATIENMMTAYPQISGIFCFMGDLAIPAYNVMQTLGRDDVLIAGYDATPEQLEIMLNDGEDCQLISSVALYPKNIGRVAMETAYGLLTGELESGVRIEAVTGMLTPENAPEFEDLEFAQ
jgi:ribose transport system substrate-binding protein